MKQPLGENPRRLRILHCIPRLEGGGAERQLRNYLVHQSSPAPNSSDRHEHAVFCWKMGEFHNDLVKSGIPVFLKPASRTRPLAALTGFVEAIRAWKPSVLQTWLPHTDVIGGLVGSVLRVPIVGSERNSRHLYLGVNEVKDRWFSKYRPWVFRHCMVAGVANSQAGSRYLVEDLRLTIPVSVIHNGIDLEAIDAVSPCVPNPFEGSPFSPIIVTASRLVPHKRIDLILEALSILSKEGLRPAFAICGDGPELEKWRNQSAAMGIEEQVQFLGKRNDTVSVLKKADIFCTASEVEGMPNAMLEAMVCGLAIVASNIPEHRDILETANAGFLFETGSATDLAARLREVIIQPSLRKTAGERASSLARTYTIDRMSEGFDDFYRRIFITGDATSTSQN